jgi:thiol peroxidase
MPKKVMFKGSPMTLVGRSLKVGAVAPDFRVVDSGLKDAGLADFKDKIKVITFFLSLDTPVCDLQVKEFNKRASTISSDIVIVGISKDLPFAQKRFCAENEIKNVKVLSDYKYSSFGINYGLLVKELNLLARGVLIIDKNDILRYFKVVDELTTPPDYDGALKNLEDIVKNPAVSPAKSGLPSKCKPCEEGTPPMPKNTIDKLLAQYRGWQLIEDKKIVKEFKLKDFAEAKYFVDLVSVMAEEQGHHPAILLTWGKVKITLTTHAAGGLTENDFIMAKIIDEIGG